MSKKVIIVASVREFSVSVPANYLQHKNAKTKYIRFYRETPVYCVLWRNVTTTDRLNKIYLQISIEVSRAISSSFFSGKKILKLRRICLLCSNHFLCLSSGIMSNKISSKAEVGYFWIHVTVQQNITCLEISVNNLKAGILM
ncbi:hypothetical protein HanLR1_Chr12g0446541 [Helianthus annuus]|nr:hypothetical protein HanHA89_Chr12g0469511 [Helianthus annuus]KAJ0675024.1 hypothetical protein HanLR1_Chr12g0446541 [Helianthus annuus]